MKKRNGTYAFCTRWWFLLFEVHFLTLLLKDLIEKSQNLKIFWARSRIGAPSSLESLMKQFLQTFESNQNKWKSMTFLIVFHPKTFLLLHFKSWNFHLYQLKVPKQLTWKYHISLKIESPHPVVKAKMARIKAAVLARKAVGTH